MARIRYPRSFAFRLTEADGERLDAVAAAADQKPGEWARAVVSKAAGIGYGRRRLVRRHLIDSLLLRQVLGEFSRQGNNLNQLVRRVHNDPALGGEAVCRALETLHTGHHAALVAILDAIGAERNL